jgi:hypothetical protein
MFLVWRHTCYTFVKIIERKWFYLVFYLAIEMGKRNANSSNEADGRLATLFLSPSFTCIPTCTKLKDVPLVIGQIIGAKRYYYR